MDPKADELVRAGPVEFVYIGAVAACAVARTRAKINISRGITRRVETGENEGNDPRSNANIITTSVLRSKMHRQQQSRTKECGGDSPAFLQSMHGGVRSYGDDFADELIKFVLSGHEADVSSLRIYLQRPMRSAFAGESATMRPLRL